ncbi:uncharacterized protein LOC141685762 [Apium graveolens]|uniref:uncharacterized protein LOC141685762 n=1 Tax=Apium graveolens TaxID=4045 RepID=UPI003D799C67
MTILLIVEKKDGKAEPIKKVVENTPPEQNTGDKQVYPQPPYPKRLQKEKFDKQFAKLLEVFKKLQINIPFTEAQEQIPSYVKFMKGILSQKLKFEELETVALTKEYIAVLQQKLPPKLKDPGSFTIPCRTLINVQKGELIMRVQDQDVTFNVFNIMKFPTDEEECFKVELVDFIVTSELNQMLRTDALERALIGESDIEDEEGAEQLQYLNASLWKRRLYLPFESLGLTELKNSQERLKPSIEKAHILELKPLPDHLRCMMSIFPNIIGTNMEVFMDNFSIFGTSYDECLHNLGLIFTRFGTPRVIISDEGSHFCNRKFTALMERYHVNHHVATSYHPQTNGQAEVSNREIKRILEKLVYGKASHLPTELEYKAYWALKKLNLDMAAAGEKRMLQLNELDEFRLQAYENNKVYKEKLKSRWSGPFIVKIVFPHGAVEIFDKHPDQAFKLNGQRLKYYYGDTVNREVKHGALTLEVEIFDVWAIDFMAPFVSSCNNLYILLVVDYVFKWVEVKALPTNDAKVVINFLHKQIFSRFGTPRVIISDEGSHFCNRKFTKLMARYHVNHHVATSYHPQTNGQAEVSNREIKRILEKVVSPSRKDWSLKLDEAV